jgi:O-antigen/teichoic acid export membrane protein
VSLKKNVAYNTILTVSNVAFPVITTPYVSRILGVENVGIIDFVVTYSSYFALFVALGIPLYGMREIAKQNSSQENRAQIFSELFVINIFSSLIFSIVYLITIFSIPSLSHDKEFLLIAGLSVLFVPLNVDWFFSGRERFKMVTLRTLTTKVLTVGGLFVFVHTRADIIPYLILNIVANLSGQLWNFGYMLKTEIRFHFRNLQIKKHLNAIFILFVSNIATNVYAMMGILLLGFMSDYIQVGYYTSATKASKIILPVVIAMSPVIIAKINTIRGETNDFAQISKLLNRSFGYMMMLALPATVGLIIVAPRFVPFFFGREFVPATISVQLLSALILLGGFSNFFANQILLGLGYDKQVAIITIFGIISGLGLNILFIPQYGSLGASIAYVVTEIIVTILSIILALKVVPVRLDVKNILQPIFASCLIIPISLGLNHILRNNLIYLLSTLVINGLVYFILMIFVFKNEQANQIFYSIIKKITTNNKISEVARFFRRNS